MRIEIDGGDLFLSELTGFADQECSEEGEKQIYSLRIGVLKIYLMHQLCYQY